ncbi:ABC transporter permease [Mangrovibacterium diazotrophicum]|uniref:Nitrate/nitrite transport system permease protein n=1 Tax=Mangrovibacterium diazotrophicum TaxID=1261403 RepID=A0A419VUN5_9BACT|nr:ABC transporter permease subunit [Mangrovibacterium diazotrophicum]RKD85063.1 nitrate/nitrite transport system permease protein [Mangrovibacterium diazotrophicum]
MGKAIIASFRWLGFSFLDPLIKLFQGVEPKKNGGLVLKKVVIPIVSVLLFLGIANFFSSYLYNIERDRKIEKTRETLGDAAALEMQECIDSGDLSCKPNSLPSPSDVWRAAETLVADHKMISADKAAFKEKTAAINAQRETQGLAPIRYTGRPSFVDQIMTSLETVFAGFLLAAFFAIPAGIVLGLSETLRTALNWVIQIFKPVSPVVWLLLVSMVVKTILATADMDKSFVISFISVGLCSMWATLVNTSVGVSSVDKDYLNVSRVLRLGVISNVFKVILPSSIPLIFTGLRITLSVAWMVLIAIELLAQSPGLGSFVWEEFQNGSSDSNAKIIVAMFVIGGIGFALDRVMMLVQKAVSYENKA